MAKLAWITGAGGLIGSHLLKAAPIYAPEWEVRPVPKAVLNTYQRHLLPEHFARERPELIIHCAAISRSDACEEDPPMAWAINVEVTAVLAELAKDIPLVFFSTDLVFDGAKGNYSEEDPVSPLAMYGDMKVISEKMVLQNPTHSVVRTSINFGFSPTGDRAFNELILMAWHRGETFTFFTDEYRCPLPAEVTARATWELVRANRPGLYHLAGSERLSRYQIGQLLAMVYPIGRDLFKAGSLAEYEGPARSPDTSLNCTKLQEVLSFPLPAFSKWLLDKHPTAPA